MPQNGTNFNKLALNTQKNLLEKALSLDGSITLWQLNTLTVSNINKIRDLNDDKVGANS